MATLPQTEISVLLVRNKLGASTNDVGLLCKHANVNMFSKKKPVRDSRDFLDYTDVGVADNYGISVPVWDGTNQVWVYNQPRGGDRTPAEPCRLDDFRGYYHEADIPFKMSDYSGVIHYAAYDNTLVISGIMSTPEGSSPALAIGDVLSGYYFAVQLKNENNDVVWGTASSPNLASITIDFSAAPFDGNDNWLNSEIEVKAFLSSAPKGFNDLAPPSVTKRALHYDAADNITTQTLEVQTGAFIEAQITGIRAGLASGTWLPSDGTYDPENPPAALVTSGAIALRVKFKNNANGAYDVYNSNMKFGVPTNYHGIERYLTFVNNLYDIDGDALSTLSVAAGQWSDEVILYEPILLNWDGSGGSAPSPPVTMNAIFRVYQYIDLLGEEQLINTVSFNKRVASS